MDKQSTKKLNRQGIWFAVLHSVLIVNIVFEIFKIH